MEGLVIWHGHYFGDLGKWTISVWDAFEDFVFLAFEGLGEGVLYAFYCTHDGW